MFALKCERSLDILTTECLDLTVPGEAAYFWTLSLHKLRLSEGWMANEVSTPVHIFKYPGPYGDGGRDRGPERGVSYPMVTNDICVSTVQVFHQKGGGTRLHRHRNEDGYWLVLGGRARFYNSDGETVADLGKFEGIFIPRSTLYRFESVDDSEPLEILRVSHHSETRDDHAPLTERDARED